MLTKEMVLKTLEQVYDPEIPVDIVNLGLIYDVLIQNGAVKVRMTTTSPGCPVGDYLARCVERALSELPEVLTIRVELVYDPPWGQQMISEEGRRLLGIA